MQQDINSKVRSIAYKHPTAVVCNAYMYGTRTRVSDAVMTRLIQNRLTQRSIAYSMQYIHASTHETDGIFCQPLSSLQYFVLCISTVYMLHLKLKKNDRITASYIVLSPAIQPIFFSKCIAFTFVSATNGDIITG